MQPEQIRQRTRITPEQAFCRAAAKILSQEALEAVLEELAQDPQLNSHDRTGLTCALRALARQQPARPTDHPTSD